MTTSSVPPTILLIGATGNTGAGVLSTLPSLLSSSQTLSSHRILVVTRSTPKPLSSESAQVSYIQYLWPNITAAWLRVRNVQRIFIAAHNLPTHFAEESSLLSAALEAGVRYVVRISTTAANVHAGTKAYYARSHWAIEAMLESDAYMGMKWASVQPAFFAQVAVGAAVGFVKDGGRGKLRTPLDRVQKVALVDPAEVGVVAAGLLAGSEEKTGRFVVHGPEDVSGEDVVTMVEEQIGRKLGGDEVVYRDTSFVDGMVAQADEGSKEVIASFRYSLEAVYDGRITADKTSAAVLKLAPPQRTAKEIFLQMLKM